MNIRSTLRKHKEAETSALNDILFILLFFFLIISTLANPNLVKVSVPKATSDTKAKQTLVISVDSLQRFYIGTKPVAADSLPSAIQAALVRFNDAEPTIVINGDVKADHGNIIAVLKAAKSMGLKTVIAVDRDR